MCHNEVRTRYAPSPTGFVHIGNLRSALYEYLVAKANKGKFILRIEDTDQKRYVEGAVNIIYETLKIVGIKHDEGPDIGGDYGPYMQSERKDIYLPYAKKLIENKKAYYCFCSEKRLEDLRLEAEEKKIQFKYDRHCLNLSADEIQKRLDAKEPFVIRQLMPDKGTTTYNDAVYGDITFDNDVLEDQILIKSDGFPTYNFANVIDDHLMKISHVVRGSEYITSTPKYVRLYEAFGWEPPIFVHLPLVVKQGGGKISKRSGDAYFSDLIDAGYLPEAIVNFIVLLGWSSGTEQEFFTLSELEKIFDIKGISKSPSTYDTDKLRWMNGEYIRKKTLEEFTEIASSWIDKAFVNKLDKMKICSMIQKRVEVLNEIPDMISFLQNPVPIDVLLYDNKKSKCTIQEAKKILPIIKNKILDMDIFDHDTIYEMFTCTAEELGVKNGLVMWPVRIALSGMLVTPGGAVEIADILGKQETLKRINGAITQLENENAKV
ncbi:MAG TPA: glutamate--tRNA ligase [Clostridia bacterium]|jgi:glutamyl-tRNA synthetase|nr:glutamate--tRNA ligase [Clostridia bacterium]